MTVKIFDTPEVQEFLKSVAGFDQEGTGRKLAIQILEFFDRLGFTRRMKDERVIRRADMWR
ncbi:hypothetical protein HIO72_00750 [Halomonas sp. PA5]|uniref:SelB domain-containing protein n=1 Tax=Halomonas sp. PA5 TaxID=2730357 RepID=UPI001599446B|nr:SelB C-terminal domain-containing protein [Halomonas sp. PA5]QJQ93967.1 hypothetical protein HIO72_00750 [Halomonas sp. PA5]